MGEHMDHAGGQKRVREGTSSNASSRREARRNATGEGGTAVGMPLFLSTTSGLGQPLPQHVRSPIEARLGSSLAHVRVRDDAAATAATRARGARAIAWGHEVMIGEGQSIDDLRLMSHEIAHISQQERAEREPRSIGTLADSSSNSDHERQADAFADAVLGGRAAPVLTRYDGHTAQADDGDNFCPVIVGTFVLDPAIANPPQPMNFAAHVRVAPPGDQGAEQYVEVQRDVQNTHRLTAIAVPLDQVFEGVMEATAESDADRELPQPIMGQQMFTPTASFTALGRSQGYAMTDQPVAEAVGAGAVVVVETNGGTLLLDAGMQYSEDGAAAAIGGNIADQLYFTISGEIAEAVLSPGAPDGHVLPHIAGNFSIGSVRVTEDQLANDMDETLAAVQAGQTEYRSWLEEELRL